MWKLALKPYCCDLMSSHRLYQQGLPSVSYFWELLPHIHDALNWRSGYFNPLLSNYHNTIHSIAECTKMGKYSFLGRCSSFRIRILQGNWLQAGQLSYHSWQGWEFFSVPLEMTGSGSYPACHTLHTGQCPLGSGWDAKLNAPLHLLQRLRMHRVITLTPIHFTPLCLSMQKNTCTSLFTIYFSV